jgi:hypothetical protein
MTSGTIPVLETLLRLSLWAGVCQLIGTALILWGRIRILAMSEHEPENTSPAQDGLRAITSREEVELGLALRERLHATKVKGAGDAVKKYLGL